jgi:hypothetical protein
MKRARMEPERKHKSSSSQRARGPALDTLPAPLQCVIVSFLGLMEHVRCRRVCRSICSSASSKPSWPVHMILDEEPRSTHNDPEDAPDDPEHPVTYQQHIWVELRGRVRSLTIAEGWEPLVKLLAPSLTALDCRSFENGRTMEDVSAATMLSRCISTSCHVWVLAD